MCDSSRIQTYGMQFRKLLLYSLSYGTIEPAGRFGLPTKALEEPYSSTELHGHKKKNSTVPQKPTTKCPGADQRLRFNLFFFAVRQRFELWIHFSTYMYFPSTLLRPLGHLTICGRKRTSNPMTFRTPFIFEIKTLPTKFFLPLAERMRFELMQRVTVLTV